MNLQVIYHLFREKIAKENVGCKEKRREGDKQTEAPTCQHPFSIQMPQWSNYKLASSGINPADSTLGLAIWQETFWPISDVVLKLLTLGERDVKSERHKARVQKREECNCPRHQIRRCV